MASKNGTVYLGFLDDQVTTKNQHYVNLTVSKIGGHPNWCVPECKTPICCVCKRKMLLVMQLYAPLENSHYHRSLYIFACITHACWNRPHSWVCLRGQVLESKQSQIPQTADVSNEFWMDDDDDDWGPEIDDGNGNIFPSTQLMHEYLSVKNKDFTDKENSNIDDNLNERDPNSSSKKIAITDVANCMENKMNLNEGDTNANDACCGAVGAQGGSGGDGMEATAVIEGPEGDMIAVDSPERPTTDIPALFKEVTKVEAKGDVSFVSYFIGTAVEPPEDLNFSEHERELFLRYTHTTGHNLKDEECFGGGPDSQGDDAMYEKISAHHGDIFLHKFKKRILRSPEQIVRYTRDDSASPLWMRTPSLSVIPKSCENCEGPMIFEAQIMPQLVSCLSIKDVPSTVLEFGTVVLYTCLSSCWSERDSIRTEFCYVQSEDA